MKRGILFTLGTFFIAATVLALAIVIFHNTEESRERVSELGSLDRLFDLSSSVQTGIKEIFEIYADFNLSIKESTDSTNVSFTENISRTQEDWGEELEEKMNNFKSYVESSDQNIKLDITAIENKEIPLIILPHNITYSRSWAIGHTTLNVIPTTLNFNSYDIIIDTADQEVTEPSSTIHEGSFYFKVIAIDNYGNYFVEEHYIDPEKENQVLIGNIIKATVKNQELEIWTNSDIPIIVTTMVDNLQKTSEKVTVEYLSGIINATFQELGISKISSIKTV